MEPILKQEIQIQKGNHMMRYWQRPEKWIFIPDVTERHLQHRKHFIIRMHF